MKFTVEQLKTRLDKAIVEHDSGFSRSKIQRDIEEGCVSVNGEKVLEAKFVVRVGDKINYIPSKEAEILPVNLPLKTLYNKDGLLILDKPPGLAVHPGAGFKGDSLSQALLYHFKDIHLVGEEGRHGIVHRLDKDTSGVMLVALTPEMYEYLKDSFSERKVKKEYLALVVGKIEKPQGKIDAPIGKSKTDFRKMATKNVIQEKPSLTEYKVLEYLKAPIGSPNGVDTYTLITVQLHTGRTHQIRVHMAHLGFPLAGDTLYGGKKTKLAGLNRQFLHARKIGVKLPDGTWIEAQSDLPPDLKEVLKNLNSQIHL